MTIHEAIRAQLLATANVAAIVVDRVYIQHLPQKPTYPAIAVNTIAINRDHSHDGSSGYSEALFRIDCASPSYAAAKDLADKARVALVGLRGSMPLSGGVQVEGIFAEDESDDYDDGFTLHIVSIDLLVQYLE